MENNISRLSDDHQKALEIESTLKKLSFINKVETVETNIIIFEIDSKISSELFLKKMNDRDVKIISMGDNKLRIVTHLNYTNVMHDKFLDILNNLEF